jgi:hypothetical protein
MQRRNEALDWDDVAGKGERTKNKSVHEKQLRCERTLLSKPEKKHYLRILRENGREEGKSLSARGRFLCRDYGTFED